MLNKPLVTFVLSVTKSHKFDFIPFRFVLCSGGEQVEQNAVFETVQLIMSSSLLQSFEVAVNSNLLFPLTQSECPSFVVIENLK